MEEKNESDGDKPQQPSSGGSAGGHDYIKRFQERYGAWALTYIDRKLGREFRSRISPSDIWQNAMQSLLENPFQLQSPVTEKAFVRGVINKHIMRAVDQIRRKKRDLGSETPIGPGGLDAIPKQNMKDMRRVSRKPKRRKPGPIVDPSVPREPDIGTKLPSSRKHMHPSRMTPLSAAEQLEGYHKLLKRLPEDQMRTIARCLGEDMADSEIAARLGVPTAAVRAKILEIRQLLESKAPLRRKPKEPGPAGEDD